MIVACKENNIIGPNFTIPKIQLPTLGRGQTDSEIPYTGAKGVVSVVAAGFPTDKRSKRRCSSVKPWRFPWKLTGGKKMGGCFF